MEHRQIGLLRAVLLALACIWLAGASRADAGLLSADRVVLGVAGASFDIPAPPAPAPARTASTPEIEDPEGDPDDDDDVAGASASPPPASRRAASAGHGRPQARRVGIRAHPSTGPPAD